MKLSFVSSARIANLVENGMIEKWRKLYYPRDLCSLQSASRLPDPATLQDTQGAFLMLGIGVALSAISLAAECSSLCCRKRRKRRTERGLHSAIFTMIDIHNGTAAELHSFS